MTEENLIIKRLHNYLNVMIYIISQPTGMRGQAWSRDLIVRSNSVCTAFFTTNNTLKVVLVLQSLVKGYNRKYHRSIKMEPNQFTEANSSEAYANLYKNKIVKKPTLRWLETVSSTFQGLQLDGSL